MNSLWVSPFLGEIGMATSLTHARVRELLNYNPKTGRFTWRVDRPGRQARKAGSIAGTLTKTGYRQICIDRRLYRSAPLAFFWMSGRWPKRHMDHINVNPSDDRWSNLREANESQNGANMRPQRKKTVPLKGVRWDKSRGRYITSIKINYRCINLGRFDDPEKAHAAYIAAARKYFGKFARAE
jgi:hypothetical protein